MNSGQGEQFFVSHNACKGSRLHVVGQIMTIMGSLDLHTYWQESFGSAPFHLCLFRLNVTFSLQISNWPNTVFVVVVRVG